MARFRKGRRDSSVPVSSSSRDQAQRFDDEEVFDTGVRSDKFQRRRDRREGKALARNWRQFLES
ncbi:MAG: hypothetical protein KC777_28240 [Cyanobacteria bacterium HKST-UBA02]|nr:hypothetical protein [Cyanobacteria bacterium HKST-UBA02]